MAEKDTNVRLAVVENISKTNSKLLSTMSETVVQLRIIAETSQKLLESHDRGIADLHRREHEREQRGDDRHEQWIDRIHQLQTDVEKKRIDDLVLLEQTALKVESCEKQIELNQGGDKSLVARVQTLENWKWKIAGIVTAITTIASFLVPYLIKVFS